MLRLRQRAELKLSHRTMKDLQKTLSFVRRRYCGDKMAKIMSAEGICTFSPFSEKNNSQLMPETTTGRLKRKSQGVKDERSDKKEKNGA